MRGLVLQMPQRRRRRYLLLRQRRRPHRNLRRFSPGFGGQFMMPHRLRLRGLQRLSLLIEGIGMRESEGRD
jgi:hypothetical protein